MRESMKNCHKLHFKGQLNFAGDLFQKYASKKLFLFKVTSIMFIMSFVCIATSTTESNSLKST